MFSAAVLVVASSMAVGQAAPLPSNHEHLKMYETLIGTWVYDGPLLEDVPQSGLKKGTPARCESIYSWGSEKNVVNVCNSWQIEGMKVTAHVVTYWDAKSKGIVQHGVNNLGGYGQHSVAYAPGTRTWTSADTIVDVAGDTVSGVNVISMADRGKGCRAKRSARSKETFSVRTSDHFFKDWWQMSYLRRRDFRSMAGGSCIGAQWWRSPVRGQLPSSSRPLQ